MNKVVALVGMCGSGKSVVNEFFRDKGYFSIYFGGITIQELEKRGMPVNPENEKNIREELRQTHGMAAFAILSLPKIEEVLKIQNVICDGLYSWSEYKVLKDKFGDNLTVVAVYAPPRLRYERLSKREIRPIMPEDSRKRDSAEIEHIEKGGPIAMADYTLVNDGDLDHLMEQVRKIFSEISI
jgi:dephospho-CoA kinase